jgi:trehalose PTS system EIIBC or EIIBCA component
MANGQFQIVIGPGVVDKVAAEIRAQTGAEEVSKADVAAAAAAHMNPLQRGIKVLGDIFIPLLPAIVTAGLLMGVNNVLVNTGIFWDDASVVDKWPWIADWASVINLIANTAFVFLPVLIGWSAVKRFGGNPLFGIVLGAMLVHPDLLNAWAWGAAEEAGTIEHWHLLWLNVQQVGYQGQVLPILVASWVLVKIELWVKERTPDMLSLLVVGPVTLLLTGLLAFIVIGPVTFWIGSQLTDGLVWVFDHAPWLGGLLYGFFYAPPGDHRDAPHLPGGGPAADRIDRQHVPLADPGHLERLPGLRSAGNDVRRREPEGEGAGTVVGNLRLPGHHRACSVRREPAVHVPFFIAISTSGLCGMWMAITDVKASSIGVGGIPGIFSIIPEYWGPFALAMLAGIVVPLVGTVLYAKSRGLEETPEQASALDEGALV